jgi:hypothetical protein
MRALCLLALLPTATLAQIVPTGTPAADILLTQALAEQRVFLTCSALDAVPHGVITGNWERQTAAAAIILADNNVPAEAIAAFAAAARPEALMPDPDTPFDSVRALCAGQADWPERYALLRYILLDRDLPGAFD